MTELVRVDEWLAELERLEKEQRETPNGPEGFTGEELAVRMGCCHRAVMYRVKEWCRSGLVEYAGRRRTVNITGGISCIPVYRLKKEAK
jgi:hypothetical protein